jgi:FkbM family methyltransferase
MITKTLARLLHNAVSRSPLASLIYLETLGEILRVFPHSMRKQYVLNALAWVQWPDVDLRARQITAATTSIKLKPHVGEFDFDAAINKRLQYEPEVFAYLESTLANYDSVIEIGANVGVFTVFFAKHVKQVFAFEPSRQAYVRLLENLHLNRMFNVQSFNCAVAAECGIVHFFEPAGHLTNGSLNESFARIFSADVKSSPTLTVGGEIIGKFVHDSDKLLIKIDAEGAEGLVLSALAEIISKHRPALIIEVLSEFEDELNALVPVGYKCYNITDHGLCYAPQLQSSGFRDWVLLPATDED